jgi:type II secretory ATPase GspE/PulE/Tfp pilus assembly ATPase PilB-like protein
MLNMGIEPFNVVASVNVVLAQRLVRRICKECKTQYAPSDEQLRILGVERQEDMMFAEGSGCDKCFNSGYKGRVALHEVMIVSDNMRDKIIEGISSNQLKTVAVEEGMYSLRAIGIRKVLQNLTTVDEVLAVSMADDA